MGFLATTIIFILIGVVASLSTLICCNRGPSTNLFHLTLVITATACCWMMPNKGLKGKTGAQIPEELLNPSSPSGLWQEDSIPSLS
ncbi:ATPase, V0 complex, subunit E isoform X1 [Wolffia australiana]